MLRQRIWSYLEDLSINNNITIVITTHYIEEARRANQVGFMRSGEIIEENHPNVLYEKYQNNVCFFFDYFIVNNRIKTSFIFRFWRISFIKYASINQK
jgi:ABC-type multidrug transport system ATPase subunit